MKKLLFPILLFTISFFTYGQEIPKFGKMPKEYMEMTVYPNDSSAEAVILFDKGDISFMYVKSQGWKLIFDRHMAIKVLSKDGYEWADQSIETYHDGSSGEQVSKLKGFTYNLDNGKLKTSKLEKTSIFKEKTNEYWDREKFTMPDVKVGSVIEFSYRITSDYVFNLKSWDFQESIPTMYSELSTHIPEYYSFRLLTQGYYGFSKNESTTSRAKIVITSSERVGTTVSSTSFRSSEVEYQINKQVLAAKDIPAMKEEAFTSTIDNYRMRVDFELQSTNFPGEGYRDFRGSWEALNNKFLESQYFGKVMDNIGNIKKEIDALSIIDSNEEKIASIYNLIRSRIKWDGFNSKYSTTNTLNPALKQGEGNVADINLALTGALRDAGFEAEPVLLSTRSNGIVRPHFPISSQFNYVVSLVKLGENEVLMDASSGLPPGYLPTKCLNGNGWVVSNSGGRWVSLSNNAEFKIMHNVEAKLSEDGKITADLKTEKTKYASFGDRSTIISQGEDSRIKKIEEENNWDVSGYEVSNLKVADKPLTENYTITTSNNVEKAGNLLIVNPLLVGEQSENPFKLEKREYPIDFTYPRFYAYQGKITLPEGYAIDEIPSPAGIALPNRKGRFIYSIAETDGVITITSLIQIKESLFLPEEYPFVKEFFSQIVEKHNEQIILKKL